MDETRTNHDTTTHETPAGIEPCWPSLPVNQTLAHCIARNRTLALPVCCESVLQELFRAPGLWRSRPTLSSPAQTLGRFLTKSLQQRGVFSLLGFFNLPYRAGEPLKSDDEISMTNARVSTLRPAVDDESVAQLGVAWSCVSVSRWSLDYRLRRLADGVWETRLPTNCRPSDAMRVMCEAASCLA
jgi:hypothetical protein